MSREELLACSPTPVNPNGFNKNCSLPYGLRTEHVQKAMCDFIEFIRLINIQLNSKSMPRLESFLMQANFSSIVGEFMNMTIPKYCSTLAKNNYHNGHPDLIPKGNFPNDSVQHSTVGIEVKGSRHASGWQGHNAEEVWLMVFHFDSNTPRDINPRPFRFNGVYAAELVKDDWSFSGRSGVSRRTITASVLQGGVEKMKKNWVYLHKDIS